MIPIDFPEKNKLYTYGPGMDLHVRDDGEYLTCCWQFNKDDLERINKNGGRVWLSIRSRFQPPIAMTVINPFAKPQGIRVPVSVVDDVRVHYMNDVELVICMVKESYHSFQITKHEETSEYQVIVKDSGFGDQVFATDFIFEEEVKVIGLVSEQYGEYDALIDLLNRKPTELLLLERVNTTIQ